MWGHPSFIPFSFSIYCFHCSYSIYLHLIHLMRCLFLLSFHCFHSFYLYLFILAFCVLRFCFDFLVWASLWLACFVFCFVEFLRFQLLALSTQALKGPISIKFWGWLSFDSCFCFCVHRHTMRLTLTCHGMVFCKVL